MDFIHGFLDTIDWRSLSLQAGRFLLILFLGWIAMRGLRLLLGRVEKALLDRQQVSSGIEALEASKRVETLIRLSARPAAS